MRGGLMLAGFLLALGMLSPAALAETGPRVTFELEVRPMDSDGRHWELVTKLTNLESRPVDVSVRSEVRPPSWVGVPLVWEAQVWERHRTLAPRSEQVLVDPVALTVLTEHKWQVVATAEDLEWSGNRPLQPPVVLRGAQLQEGVTHGGVGRFTYEIVIMSEAPLPSSPMRFSTQIGPADDGLRTWMDAEDFVAAQGEKKEASEIGQGWRERWAVQLESKALAHARILPYFVQDDVAVPVHVTGGVPLLLALNNGPVPPLPMWQVAWVPMAVLALALVAVDRFLRSGSRRRTRAEGGTKDA